MMCGSMNISMVAQRPIDNSIYSEVTSERNFGLNGESFDITFKMNEAEYDINHKEYKYDTSTGRLLVKELGYGLNGLGSQFYYQCLYNNGDVIYYQDAKGNWFDKEYFPDMVCPFEHLDFQMIPRVR